jgi:hypothetical protein
LALREISPSSSFKLQKEWAFLCACASPLLKSEDIAALLTGPLDWDALFELAEKHGVLGLLAKRMQKAEPPAMPLSVREKLQSRMRAQHLFTLSMTAELFRILQDFSVARMEAVLVKGPVLSVSAYGDSSVRSYADLDLLLRQRDIHIAAQRMLELGFHSNIPPSAINAGKIPGEYQFRKPSARQIVELHTEHTFRYYPKLMPIDSLFARKRMLPLDGRDVPALSLEDEFVLDCVHGAKDFWERLIWISDVAATVANRPEMDWDKVRRAAAQVGAERMLRVATRLAAMLLGTKIPSVLSAEIANDRAVESLCRRILAWLPFAGAQPPTLVRRAMFRFDMADGGLTGAAFLARVSLSPTQEDWTEKSQDKRSWLWDAVRRPIRLFRKYGSSE